MLFVEILKEAIGFAIIAGIIALVVNKKKIKKWLYRKANEIAEKRN